jgi:hypothetical protein
VQLVLQTQKLFFIGHEEQGKGYLKSVTIQILLDFGRYTFCANLTKINEA